MERLSFILFIFLFSLPSFSSIPPTLDSQIRKKRKIISNLTRELNFLEKNLGKKNYKYMRVVEKRKRLEDRVFWLKKSNSAGQREIETKIREIKLLLGRMVITQIEEEKNPEELLAQEVLKSGLKKKLAKLQKNFQQIRTLRSEIDTLSRRLKEYSQIELQLFSFIDLMEKKKSSKAHTYLKQKESYQQLTQRMAYQKSKALRKKKHRGKWQELLGTFSSPLKGYEKIEHEGKGVTYLYRKRRPVLATRKGRIIHSGLLSTFGHVIMIDHGKEIRSVLLGPFESKVKKGMLVREREILGYTIGQSHHNIGKLYFEVRKKNKVQNTIHLLDTKFMAQGNSLQNNS